MMKVRKVCTCLPEEDYINALLHGISFAEALRIGLQIKLGEDNAEEKLTEEITEINNLMAYKQKRLSEVRQKKEEENLRLVRENFMTENKCFLCDRLIKADKKFQTIHGRRIQLHSGCSSIRNYEELMQKVEINTGGTQNDRSKKCERNLANY